MRTAVVVGSINQDVVAYVTRHPLPGETVVGCHGATFPGGKGANQAVAIARLKRPVDGVRMIGRVGRDAFGRDLVAFMAAQGIDTTAIEALPDVGTGMGLITVDANGENAIAVVPGANHRWPVDLPSIAVAPVDIVVCQLEVPMPVVTHAFSEAKRQRAMTLLNPAPYQPVPPSLLAETDVLVLNEIEIAQMLDRATGDLDEQHLMQAARALIEQGPGAVVVTLGAAGALVVERAGRAQRIPGRPVKTVDTTGAGDCFVGAVAAALMRGDDLAAAAVFANAAAAISVTRPGAASSIPHLAEVSV